MFRGRIVPIGENEQQNMREIRAINFIIFVGLVFYGTLLEPSDQRHCLIELLMFWHFLCFCSHIFLIICILIIDGEF